jgi:pyruvate/2-oxoglutarate dehydrogenase complex dihydrolipoamide dehydrogenase (E3) component
LNLEGVGVQFGDRDGVAVDDFLQTTNPNIFACGDVCLRWKFTHAADFAARIVIQNSLFSVAGLGRKRISSLTMPWCTDTDPEIAHVGLSEHVAAERGLGVDVWVPRFAHVDRAITDGEEQGLVTLLTARGKGRLVGATIVARHAGEMIGEISTAMAGGVSLGKIASVIHPYPTQAEAIRKCGDQFNKGRLTPTVKRLFEKWLSWGR